MHVITVFDGNLTEYLSTICLK